MEQQNQQPIQEKMKKKPAIKTNWKFVAIVLILSLVAVGGILLLRGIFPASPTQQPTVETRDKVDAAKNSSPIRFIGEVVRGQTFEKEIGRGLVLRLTPGSGEVADWTISIGDKTDPESDFTSVVNSPYRGIINHIYIAGWHLRNADNSGPNDGSINAPGNTRKFFFVLNKADAEEAARLLDKILWPATERGWEELDKNLALHEAIPKGEGVLTIMDMELGNLAVGEQAWIEEMKFEVELTFPEDSQELDTSTWQTYRSDEFGFEVEHPRNWLVRHDKARWPESDDANPRFIIGESDTCYTSLIFKNLTNPEKTTYSLSPEADKKQECQKILDQILSTFRFTP